VLDDFTRSHRSFGAFVSYSAGSFGIRAFISSTKGVTQAHHATAVSALSQIGKKVNVRIQAIQKPINRFMAVRCRTSIGIAPDANRKKAGLTNQPLASNIIMKSGHGTPAESYCGLSSMAASSEPAGAASAFLIPDQTWAAVGRILAPPMFLRLGLLIHRYNTRSSLLSASTPG